MSIASLKLCLVTQSHNQPLEDYLQFLSKAIEGGVTSVQLREKNIPRPTLQHKAKVIKKRLDLLHIPLMINDDVELAHELDLFGVHLGQNDMSPIKAREILGPDKIIGLSIESLHELHKANELDCINYVGASAVFPSTSKEDCKKIWGLNGLKELAELSRYPVVAIGGINQGNIQSVFQHGASGAAVISAIHHQPCAESASKNLFQSIQEVI